MPSVMSYVTVLTKPGSKIRRRAHLFRDPPHPSRNCIPRTHVLVRPFRSSWRPIQLDARGENMEIQCKLLERDAIKFLLLRIIFHGRSESLLILREMSFLLRARSTCIIASYAHVSFLFNANALHKRNLYSVLS